MALKFAAIVACVAVGCLAAATLDFSSTWAAIHTGRGREGNPLIDTRSFPLLFKNFLFYGPLAVLAFAASLQRSRRLIISENGTALDLRAFRAANFRVRKAGWKRALANQAIAAGLFAPFVVMGAHVLGFLNNGYYLMSGVSPMSVVLRALNVAREHQHFAIWIIIGGLLALTAPLADLLAYRAAMWRAGRATGR
jgi:hypothetical protein